ncbi:hypothetical protein L198_01564 [Cryptococcus wingfieldii CBS 7118]|uniref:Fe2OG dioxygenase domain-containing protein n=1 Tax=Cryptococcus wingfieldii CBS 7118 TaxID=1295528 RepID=A0A1E3K296_9TREE|nr:hypothetical protein L198_01564 [Cryptococcus wingfieldii CBS 7118]ODO06332.1 hypothetical protein L198_01564 [Cryptococcus wingfieldii CBS 7118]
MSSFSATKAVEALIESVLSQKNSRKRKRPTRSVTEELEDILPSLPILTPTPFRWHRFDYSPSPSPLPSPSTASDESSYEKETCKKSDALLLPVKASTFNRALRIMSGLPVASRAARQAERREKPKERPPVWAESRQELCEALPYYRSFQSGLYMHSKVTFGYLLEAFPAPLVLYIMGDNDLLTLGLSRDAWASNGRVIISHGGGQCICPKLPNGKQGPPVLQADQSRSDARVDALLTAAERRTPIVLIAGEGYKELPWKLDCAYVVLGWYWISYTWVEAEPAYKGTKPPSGRDYFHRIKIRFDWVESQGDPWWDSEIPVSPLPVNQLSSTPRRPCGISSSSEAAEMILSFEQPSPKTSTHNFESYTESTPSWPGASELPISSPDLQGEDHNNLRWLYLPHLRLAKPQNLHRRSHLRSSLMPRLLPPSHPSRAPPHSADFHAHPLLPYEVVPPGPVEDWPEADEGGLGGAGEKTLWRGWVCSECGRANCRYRWEVWECQACGNSTAQLNASHQVPLCRLTDLRDTFLGDGVIRHSTGVSASLTVSRELGAVVAIYELPEAGKVYHIMPFDKQYATELFYEYQREATSKSWFQRRSLKSGSLLAQHFAFNSGVPYKYIVDTLSTPFDESPACVTKAVDRITSSVATVWGEEYQFNEILSVCYREGQKMGYHDDGEPGLGPVVASLSLGSSAMLSFRPKPGEKQRGNPDVALNITLSHGDFMIMDGHEIQRKYHHRVVPQGFRIAATARRISPAKPDVQVKAGVEAEDTGEVKYDDVVESCLGPDLSRLGTAQPVLDPPRYSSRELPQLPPLHSIFDHTLLPRRTPIQHPYPVPEPMVNC